mmetsp:Transcript_111405/g.300511  ORF Transcript_111405/g.300511 Transcript_111405/m.300511 type:complete len:366 (-) Transcript_111405:64-1161(-)
MADLPKMTCGSNMSRRHLAGVAREPRSGGSNLLLAAGGLGVTREAVLPDIPNRVVRGLAEVDEEHAQVILEWLSGGTKSSDPQAAARRLTEVQLSVQGVAPVWRPDDVPPQRRVFEVRATPLAAFSAFRRCFEEQRPAEILTMDESMFCFTALTFEDFVALHIEVRVFAHGVGAVVMLADLGRTDTVLYHRMLDGLSKVVEPIGRCDSKLPSLLLDFDDDNFGSVEDSTQVEVGVTSWHDVLAPLFSEAVKVSPKRAREHAWQMIARLSKSEPDCHVAMAELAVTKCCDIIAVALRPCQSALTMPLAEIYPMAAALRFASRTPEAAEKIVSMDIFSQRLCLSHSLPRCLLELVAEIVSQRELGQV